MSTKTEREVIEWLATGKTGLSSETMAFWLGFGIKRRPFFADRVDHPHDPADFDRCLRLLEAAPSLRKELDRMAVLSKAWKRLVTNWDAIERCHLDEVGLGWTKARCAPKTYALMRKVIGDAP